MLFAQLDETLFALIEVTQDGGVIEVVDTMIGMRMFLPLWFLWLPTVGASQLLNCYSDLGYDVLDIRGHREHIRAYRHFKSVLNESGFVNNWFWEWDSEDVVEFYSPTSSESST